MSLSCVVCLRECFEVEKWPIFGQTKRYTEIVVLDDRHFYTNAKQYKAEINVDVRQCS